MIAEAKEKFRNYLKNRKNHRITPERFKVLEAALLYPGHFGADELYQAMKDNHFRVSRATVYNTLELLAQCGLLSKRNFGDNTNRYEAGFGKTSHDHLVCSKCGTIIEFSNPQLKPLLRKISDEFGFEITGYSFNVYGHCRGEHKGLKEENR